MNNDFMKAFGAAHMAGKKRFKWNGTTYPVDQTKPASAVSFDQFVLQPNPFAQTAPGNNQGQSFGRVNGKVPTKGFGKRIADALANARPPAKSTSSVAKKPIIDLGE